jgi:hypothetical protein
MPAKSPLRKSRQGLPRRLVPLRSLGGALRREELERGASSYLDALSQLGDGALPGPMIPDTHDV